MAQMVKSLPAMQKRPGFNPWDGKIPGEVSGNLAWKIPWTEKPGRLQSMGCFLKWSCITMNFPLRSAYATSHTIWVSCISIFICL